MRVRRWFALPLLALVLMQVSCTSGPRWIGHTAEQTWQNLHARRESFQGARSFARIRTTQDGRRERFHANLLIDGEGRMELTALSPIGTAVFTLVLDGDRVVMANHRANTYWSGSIEEVPETLGLPIAPDRLPFLLLALPPELPTEQTIHPGGLLVATGEGFSSIVDRRGIVETTVSGARPIRVRYQLPSFPPVRVTLSLAGGAEAEVEHVELDFEPTVLSSSDFGSYRRVATPGLLR